MESLLIIKALQQMLLGSYKDWIVMKMVYYQRFIAVYGIKENNLVDFRYFWYRITAQICGIKVLSSKALKMTLNIDENALDEADFSTRRGQKKFTVF